MSNEHDDNNNGNVSGFSQFNSQSHAEKMQQCPLGKCESLATREKVVCTCSQDTSTYTAIPLYILIHSRFSQISQLFQNKQKTMNGKTFLCLFFPWNVRSSLLIVITFILNY